MRKSVLFRSFILICIMLVSVTALFAQEVDITWNWTATQEGISAFRYQMDGELDGAWTVVDASVTSYETGPVDATVTHVLYVQQSFDGINWSASGSTVFDPIAYAASLVEPVAEQVVAEVPAEVPVPVEEPVEVAAVVEEVPAEVPAEVVAEVAVVEAVEQAPSAQTAPVAAVPTEVSIASAPAIATAPVAAPVPLPVVDDMLNGTRTGIELSGGLGGIVSNIVLTNLFETANTYQNLQTKVLPVLSLDFVADNLVRIGEKMGIGLRAGLGYQLYAPDSNKINFADVHVLGKFDISLGRKLAMEIGVGATLVVPYADLNANSILPFNSADINMFYGPVGQLNARYNISNSLSVIMQIEGRLLFSGMLDLYELTGFGRVGLGYRF